MVLMWDSALYTKLINDNELIQYVSRTGDYPSIFSDSAPENVAFPYIIFTIAGTNGPDSAVDVFSVTIDHYDFQQSAKRSRLAIKRIVELLDREHLEHADFKAIRLYKSWTAAAPKSDEIDPRARHYIAKFSARAGRKGWIENYVST